MSATYDETMLCGRLKELHLPAIRSCFDEEVVLARQESLTYEHYLQILTERESQLRRSNRIERFLRESKLPLEKRLDTFDLGRLPSKAAMQARSLLSGGFLDRCENVLAFGNPGSGKTHLLCAISQELIRSVRRIYFSTCSMLVQELLRAKQELRMNRFLKSLARYEAIVLDDIGYVQQQREEMEVLFTLLAERYERRSVMLTSNLPFSRWEEIFKDPMTTAAAIDRLVHHSVIIELNVPSYRLEEARHKEPMKAEATADSEA